MNATYEAVYRIASALFAEYEKTGAEGYVTYQERARILNRFGYEKQAGGEYTESHGKALGQMASAAWQVLVAATNDRRIAAGHSMAIEDSQQRFSHRIAVFSAFCSPTASCSLDGD